MKTIKYLMIALVGGLMTSCMSDDWDAPDTTNAFGNNAIEETNVVTIADLKAKHSSTIFNSTNSLQQITDDIQIKAVVTGNDIGGNIYNQIAVNDGTGALLICIAQGGLFAYLPVGQEILVNLKDLYIGGYGQQPQIGTPYTNKNGSTYVSRMNRMLWQEHFRLLGPAKPETVVAEEFDKSKVADEDYKKANCGKLMVIKGVEFSGADGTKVFATEDEKDAANCVDRTLKNIKSGNLVVRTSTYADFAALPLPAGKVNITGVFTRYRDKWQIQIRSEKDVEVAE